MSEKDLKMWPPMVGLIVCIIVVVSIEYYFRHLPISIPASMVATEGYVFLTTPSGTIDVTCPSEATCGDIHITEGNWVVQRGTRPIHIVDKFEYKVPFPAEGCYASTGKIDCSQAGWPDCKYDGMEATNRPCRATEGHYFEGDTKGNFKEVKP